MKRELGELKSRSMTLESELRGFSATSAGDLERANEERRQQLLEERVALARQLDALKSRVRSLAAAVEGARAARGERDGRAALEPRAQVGARRADGVRAARVDHVSLTRHRLRGSARLVHLASPLHIQQDAPGARRSRARPLLNTHSHYLTAFIYCMTVQICTVCSRLLMPNGNSCYFMTF